MKKIILLAIAAVTLAFVSPASAALNGKHHHNGNKSSKHAAYKHSKQHHYAKAYHHKHA